MRTTVAVSGPCRAPPKTQAPADFSSSLRTWISFQDCCISSSVIGSPTSPSMLLTDNRYCAMVVLPRGGRALPASHPCYERAPPRLTCVQEKLDRVGQRWPDLVFHFPNPERPSLSNGG